MTLLPAHQDFIHTLLQDQTTCEEVSFHSHPSIGDGATQTLCSLQTLMNCILVICEQHSTCFPVYCFCQVFSENNKKNR